MSMPTAGSYVPSIGYKLIFADKQSMAAFYFLNVLLDNRFFQIMIFKQAKPSYLMMEANTRPNLNPRLFLPSVKIFVR